MALTAKQQRFVAEYLVDLNATQAAIRAGYSERSAGSIGEENLKKPEIAAAVADAQRQRAERMQVSQDRVVSELAAVGFSRLGDYASWNAEELRLVESERLDESAMAALREVVARVETTEGEHGSRTTRHVQVRTHDKLRALELLGRHLGMWKEGVLPEGPVEVRLVWPEQASE